MAWLPYILLVIIVLVWGYNQTALRGVSKVTESGPACTTRVEIVSPVSKAPGPYAATYRFDWLSASGTACLIVSVISAFLLGMSPGKLASVFFRTVQQLALAELTIASVMGLAYPDELFQGDRHLGAGIRRHRARYFPSSARG